MADAPAPSPVSFSCHHCGKRLRVAAHLAEIEGPCPGCGTTTSAKGAPPPPSSDGEGIRLIKTIDPSARRNVIQPLAPPPQPMKRKKRKSKVVKDTLERSVPWICVVGFLLIGGVLVWGWKNHWDLPWKPADDSIVWRFINKSQKSAHEEESPIPVLPKKK